MTHLEKALLEALGQSPGGVASIELIFQLNHPPIARVTLYPDPAKLDAATESIIKRFELAEITDTEDDAA